MTKVSIIIPVYNTEKYLEKCLDFVINQTLNDIEIICVNDGSTDNSLSILKKYAQKDKRIKIIEQENLKQGAARNRGFRIAQGEYVGYIDSDDWVDLEYFEKLYSAAKKYNSDIALAANVRIGNGKTKKRLEIKEEKFVTSLQDKIDISNQAKNPCPTNKIYRKDMLIKHNIIWPEGIFCEDKMYTLQALYYANGIVAVPDIYYYYFRNPASTVKSRNKCHVKMAKKDKEQASLNVLKFLKSVNAKIKEDFWAITKKIPSDSFPLISVKESLKTKKYYLFGVIKILERK